MTLTAVSHFTLPHWEYVSFRSHDGISIHHHQVLVGFEKGSLTRSKIKHAGNEGNLGEEWKGKDETLPPSLFEGNDSIREKNSR